MFVFLKKKIKNYNIESARTPGGSPLKPHRYLSIKTVRCRGDSLEKKDLLILCYFSMFAFQMFFFIILGGCLLRLILLRYLQFI